ncbi:MAG: hypothetical protein R6V49_06445, partial [Bacteroidales bacterium]
MIPREDCILLGKITKKRGFEGQLLIRLDHQDYLKHKIPESVFIEIQGRLVPFFIESLKKNPPASVIVTLSDLNETLLERILQCNVFVRNMPVTEKQAAPPTI